MTARIIRVVVDNKAQIGVELRGNNRPRSTAVPDPRSQATRGSNPNISKRVRTDAHAKPDQQVAKAKGKDDTSPELQDWLNRVVLPILKKVIFDV
jgi:hypothetical protein